MSILWISANAQEFKVRDVITFVTSVPIESKEIAYQGMTAELQAKVKNYLDPGVKFYIVAINDKTVKLIAADFKTVSDERKARLQANAIPIQSEYYNGKFYTITLENLIAFAEKVEPKDKISIGLLTLPFKARLQEEFAFDTEFNLNSTLNIRLGEVAGMSFHYQFGAGVGSVNLNTGNANGLTETQAQDVSILTFFNGFMVEFNKIQVGLYAGVDHINNQKNYDWQSHGNIWLGFGLGYNLFKLSSSEPKNVQSGD